MFKQRGEGLASYLYPVLRDNCGTTTTVGTVGRLSNGWTETSSGVSIPGFFRVKEEARKSNRLLPMTPWAQTYKSASGYEDQIVWPVVRPCDRYTLHTTGVDNVDIPSMPGTYVPPDNQDALTHQAIAALYKEGWDAGTFVSQFNKSVETAVSLIKRWHKLVKDGKLSLADMGNPVSELAWAWRPMLYDLQDLIELVSELGDDRSGKAWRKHSGMSTSYTEQRVLDNVSTNYTLRVTETWDLIYSERVTAHSMIAPPRVLFDPLVTGWELVPFSFVLDKLIDIGAFLASLSAQIWHQDLQLAYGTQQTLYYARKQELVKPGLFTGVVNDSWIKARVQTSRQPFDSISWRPHLTKKPLNASTLIFWIELMRKLRFGKK